MVEPPILNLCWPLKSPDWKYFNRSTAQIGHLHKASPIFWGDNPTTNWNHLVNSHQLPIWKVRKVLVFPEVQHHIKSFAAHRFIFTFKKTHGQVIAILITDNGFRNPGFEPVNVVGSWLPTIFVDEFYTSPAVLQYAVKGRRFRWLGRNTKRTMIMIDYGGHLV